MLDELVVGKEFNGDGQRLDFIAKACTLPLDTCQSSWIVNQDFL